MGLEVHTTADGSRTLFTTELNEPYHSLYGAVTESRHVFIQAGFNAVHRSHISVLEVGLGTGLNLLLTMAETGRRGSEVDYTAIEPAPITLGMLRSLDHGAMAGLGTYRSDHERMMCAAYGQECRSPGTTFRMLKEDDALATGSFDLIYYDAFAPSAQPELWTLERFNRMHALLKPYGILVTYCAKGAVRRAMQEVGFAVERLPGPPGKAEMLRARRAL